MEDITLYILKYYRKFFGARGWWPFRRLPTFHNLLNEARKNQHMAMIKVGGTLYGGTIDHLGRDMVVLLGENDDIVSIPMKHIDMVRIYNDVLDEALKKKAMAEAEAKAKEAEAKAKEQQENFQQQLLQHQQQLQLVPQNPPSKVNDLE